MWTPEPHWSVPVVFRSGLSGVEELDRPETVNPPQAPATAGSTEFCRLVLHLYQDSFCRRITGINSLTKNGASTYVWP